MGRQQGNALLNLLISLLWQEKEEGGHKGPPQPCQRLGEGGLWACQGQAGQEHSIHISALSGKQRGDEFTTSQQ